MSEHVRRDGGVDVGGGGVGDEAGILGVRQVREEPAGLQHMGDGNLFYKDIFHAQIEEGVVELDRVVDVASL